jgi:hypothetical protein
MLLNLYCIKKIYLLPSISSISNAVTTKYDFLHEEVNSCVCMYGFRPTTYPRRRTT